MSPAEPRGRDRFAIELGFGRGYPPLFSISKGKITTSKKAISLILFNNLFQMDQNKVREKETPSATET
jgi:hypothetical protein